MTITAAMVKELRERTGAGMMECKKALEETKGDINAAITEMRKRGQAKAAKRAGKITAEGIIAIAKSTDQKKAYMVEVNCETDFVAREMLFREWVNQLADRGLACAVQDVDALLTLPITEGSAINFEERRHDLVVKIGENIRVRRVVMLESPGALGSYLHGDRIGVLVAIDKNEKELAKDIAMHIAATNPQAIDESDLRQEVVESEREILTTQAEASGKPDEIVARMVAGRINKFIQEVCLVGQSFVKNPDQTVGQLLQEHHAQVVKFVRFEVGEGVEKEAVDFAKEVKAQLQGSE